MTSTKIDWSFNKITRLSDVSDLAEMLFPGNRNQQHAFLVIWNSLKWADHHMVPNLQEAADRHGVTRRTLERVRAKLRRIGLIDHVSRFNKCHGYREGWVFSSRFERSLMALTKVMTALRDGGRGDRDKGALLIELADARRHVSPRSASHVIKSHSGGESTWN